ncbi:MAG: hypothetical protein J6T32_03450 [Paludibacteraceae bacterium]|nr:hypothetical protein [Paludibacteraceae bacterium]
MKHSLFFFLPLLLIACKPYSSPSPKKVLTVDTVFTSGMAEVHGMYYSHLERNVYSLTLLSKGLTMRGDTLFGTGSELVFTDIFLPSDTRALQEGDYKVDSTATTFSALSAMEFEGAITGTYLLLLSDGLPQRVYMFPSGSFTLRQWDDTTDMEIHLQTFDSQTFDATYRGVIQYR